MPTTVVIGSDHAGVHLKKLLADHFAAAGHTVVDVGPDDAKSVDYPLYAVAACDAVLARNALGILICGTGLGMSMTANRRPGIRAALCGNEFMARMARLHNDANILCLGERVTGQGLALAIADAFLATGFEGGRHQRRLDLMETCHGGAPDRK
jgi:ribose 5-phosphate isomerase B